MVDFHWTNWQTRAFFQWLQASRISFREIYGAARTPHAVARALKLHFESADSVPIPLPTLLDSQGADRIDFENAAQAFVLMATLSEDELPETLDPHWGLSVSFIGGPFDGSTVELYDLGQLPLEFSWPISERHIGSFDGVELCHDTTGGVSVKPVAAAVYQLRITDGVPRYEFARAVAMEHGRQ